MDDKKISGGWLGQSSHQDDHGIERHLVRRRCHNFLPRDLASESTRWHGLAGAFGGRCILQYRTSEDDAYYNTELWTIERGLPSQGKGLRTKDAKTGKIVPNKKGIRKLVQEEYPSPPPPMAGKPQPIPISADRKKNLTLVEDPVTGAKSWRPSKKGDTFAGPQTKVNAKTIKQSDWKCP